MADIEKKLATKEKEYNEVDKKVREEEERIRKKRLQEDEKPYLGKAAQ